MKRFRWLGLPAVAALAVLLFALTAGIGSARTAVAPNNTSPPTISGKAQVGELLKADPGTWTGTPAPTLTYQWRICDNNGGACHDITGATGNEYTLKSADQGNTVRVQVTGKNTDGTDTATSVPSALIAAGTATTPTATTPTPGPSGTGCPKLAAGATSVAATDVSPPARLQVTQMQANPGVITLGTKTFSVKFRVSDTCGSPVKGAQVYATTVPFNQFSIPSQSQTDDSGSVTMQFNMLRGFPAATQQRLLVMFVRASKPGDPILAGISTRRLISFRVNLHG
jgi:hypothetical protein